MVLKDGNHVTTWKVNLPLRIVGTGVSLVFLAFAGYAAFPIFSDGFRREYVGPGVIFAAGGIAGLLYCFATSIRLTEDRVVVRNLGLANEVCLSDIVEMEAGYSGTVLTTREGRTVRALAVEKPNYAKWLGRTSRSDRVLASIRAAIRQASAPPGAVCPVELPGTHDRGKHRRHGPS